MLDMAGTLAEARGAIKRRGVIPVSRPHMAREDGSPGDGSAPAMGKARRGMALRLRLCCSRHGCVA